MLIAGHEYLSSPEWRERAGVVARRIITCQLAIFEHPNGTFDDRKFVLFCHSDEMEALYRLHRPRRALAVGLGLKETPEFRTNAGGYLLWMGRIHRDKAPHLAALAARSIGLELRLAGPILDLDYFRTYRSLLTGTGVSYLGELAGPAKMALISGASVFLYTQSPDYVEAGGIIFCEVMRCGIPVAAITWRGGDAATTAVCESAGFVRRVSTPMSDPEVARELAAAVESCLDLSRRTALELGRTRFDPKSHFLQLAGE